MNSLFHPTPDYDWSLLVMKGVDAKDFLHRLTTVDVKNLAEKSGAFGFFLSPQGKIKTSFTLWHYELDTYAFEFDALKSKSEMKALIETIEFYQFSEKFELAPVSEKLRPLFLLSDGDTFDLSEFETRAHEMKVRISRHKDWFTSDSKSAFFTVWGLRDALTSFCDSISATEISANEFELLRIRTLTPWSGKELTSSVIPLECGFKTELSIQKGCYPGQEVIERMISIGSPARFLSLIEGKGEAIIPGEKILNEAAIEIGECTSSVKTKQGEFSALAFIRKIHAKKEMPFRTLKGETGKVVGLV